MVWVVLVWACVIELKVDYNPCFSPSLPLSHSPSLFFGSLALSSPAGLAGTPSSPSPSPHLSHTLQSGTTEDRPFLPLKGKTVCLVTGPDEMRRRELRLRGRSAREEAQEFLCDTVLCCILLSMRLFCPTPPEVLQQIVQETLRLDMAMLGVFNRVSNTFRELIKPLHPSIYINDSLAGDIKLNKDNLIYITVRKIYNNAGCGSGLALRLKGFSKKKNWPSAPLVLRHVAYGRYVIKDVCLA
ncbi:unnamed protein product [Arctogadus glacialis]